MTHFDSCETCDFRDSPLTCHARVVGHRAFCGDPKYRAYLREMTTGEKPPPPPSLGRKVVSFGKAVVGHVADGGRTAPPEVQDARKAECEACPHFDGPNDRCGVCGCHLSIKRSWASSVCPLTPPRWEAYRCDDGTDSPATPPSPSNPG